jgi:hypothetical protein
MQAYRIETTLQQDGTVTLQHLPFQAGEPVEIIVLARSAEDQSSGAVSDSYASVMASIRKRQKARGYQAPTRAEVDAALQNERDGWDD